MFSNLPRISLALAAHVKKAVALNWQLFHWRNQNQYGVEKYGTKRYAIEKNFNLNYTRFNL